MREYLHSFVAQISGSDIPDLPKGDVGDDNVEMALRIAFGIAGAIALLIITLAGLRYTLSQGDPQTTAKAKNAILYALIGLIVIVMSAVIVAFLIGNV